MKNVFLLLMVYFGLGAVVAFGQKTLSSKAPEGYISNVSSNRPALQDKPGAEKTALLSVVYVDDYCCGYDPWYAGTNVTAMDDVFGAGNWSDETYSTVNPAELFSSNTCFIWLDGGADHDVAMQAFTQANKAAMEAWVAGGGILLFNSAGWDTPVGPVFGGVVLNWDYYYYSASYDAAITGGQGGHPIFNGPFLPVGSSWTGGYFSHDFVSGPYGTELISGTAGPILTEKTWGSGRVMFGGMTATYFHSPYLEAYNLRKNILAYLAPLCNTGCPDEDDDSICDEDDNCPDDYNPGQADTDNDNYGDACDDCPYDPNKITPGACGCGWPESAVTGLPCYWYSGSTGSGCTGAWSYNPGQEVFTGSSSNCYYVSPFNQDEISYTGIQMCGNGSITAEVTNISSDAWAGVFMRESFSPGSKKAHLMTNLGPLHRREYRTATNGYAFPQQFSSNSRYWLRIVRQGNNFTMYSSPNGQAWYLIASQPIQMSGCIQMGLLVTNDQQTGSAWATFDNVSVTGSVGSLVTAPDMLVASPPQGVEETSFSVFPNPTSGELNVNLSEYEGKKISLEVLNLQGQVIHSQEIDEVQTWVMPLNLDVSYRGMYLLRVRSEGIADAVQRFVIQR